MASTSLFAFVGILVLYSVVVARSIPVDRHGIPGLASHGSFALRDISPAGGLAVGLGRIGLRSLGRRACQGSLFYSPCKDNLNSCCPSDSVCCPGAKCCSGGTECQINFLKETVCCVKGNNCTNDIPPVSTNLSGIVVRWLTRAFSS